MDDLATRIARLTPEQRELLNLRLKSQPPNGESRGVPRRQGDRSTAPLSATQRRLWFLHQLSPGDTAYCLPAAFRIRGPLDEEALERSLNEIVARHEMLRSRFEDRESGPVQVVDPFLQQPLRRVDLSVSSSPERAVTTAVCEESACPFDLTKGPLIRFQLYRLGDSDWVLFLNAHHLVCDEWSIAVFGRELAVLYPAFAAGLRAPLTPLDVQFADYACWEQDALSTSAEERELSYWRHQLDGLTAARIPGDAVSPPEGGHAGAHLTLEISRETSAALMSLSSSLGVTRFVVVLTALLVLTKRYTGEDDVAVGTPYQNRRRPELEPLIGFFVNTLVIRADLSGSPDFVELVHRVKQLTLDSYSHAQVPFERVMETMGGAELFQILFAWQNEASWSFQLPGLDVSRFEFETATAKFDLLISAGLKDGRLVCTFEYRTAVYECATVERIGGNFRNLLDGIAANPHTRISRLPLFGEWERSLVLDDLSDQVSRVALSPVYSMVETQALRTPDSTAVEFDDARLTYAELNKQANRLAHHLRMAAVGPEITVGICFDRSLALPVSILAILKAGGVYVPLDPSYPAERLSFMLGDCGARIVLTESRLRSLFEGYEGTVVCVDTIGEELEHRPETNPTSGVDALNLAYILYTSGSTGRPKGVAMTHACLANLLQWQTARMAPGPRRVLNFAPAGFDVSFQELFSTWWSGGTVVLVADECRHDPELLVQELSRRDVERLFLPYAALQQLASAGTRVCPVREIITAGEQLVITGEIRELCERWRCTLENQYGPTEAHVVTAFLLASEPEEWPEVPPIGRPISNARIYVLDRDLLPAPVGVPGELYIAGRSLARGYCGRSDLTAERFLPDPIAHSPGSRMYRTGDLAKWRSDGQIDFLGRADTQVKIRGFRVELGEIEAALAEIQCIRQAVVVARDHIEKGRGIVAYILGEPDAALDPAALRRRLQSLLPGYMVPDVFCFVEEFPLTASGKIDRRRLPAPSISPELDRGEDRSRTPLESILSGIWSTALGAGVIGVHDNFFALGGHSLLATRVVSRIRRDLGVELPVRTLFENPTLAELAAAVEGLSAKSAVTLPEIVPAPRGVDLPLSFSQQRLWFLKQLSPDDHFYNIPAEMRILGNLDVDVLTRSLNEIVSRHDALRTTVHSVDGRAVQRIAPPGPASLRLIDVSASEPVRRARESAEILERNAAEPYDLEAGPLYRACLIRMGPEEHILSLNVHHLVYDGWSMNVFMREFSTLFEAFSEGRASPLGPLPVQYADFAYWQREWFRGGVLDAQLVYWKDKLADLQPLALPTDRPRRKSQRYRGVYVPVVVPAALTGQLREISRQHAVTLFMTLLGAFQIGLSRYTKQTDLAVGSPIANRRRPELEALIGFFVNTLVLRTELSAGLRFPELLARVRETALGAYGNQDLPFEQLVEELQPDRSMSRNPLVQVVFALQNATTGTLSLPGLTLAPVDGHQGSVRFDLECHLWEVGEELRGFFAFDADLFEEPTIRRMARQYQTLLESIAADPQQRIADLEMVSAEERAQVARWNDTATTFPREATVQRLFEEQVELRGDVVALEFGERTTTYRELNERANRLAHHLRSLGVRPEDRVGICVKTVWEETVVGMLGILKAGGAYVPLDASYPVDRLRKMLRDSGAVALVTERGLLEEIEGIARVYADYQSAAECHSAPLLVQPGNLAYLMYTSGSTGEPKGIGIPHRAIVRLVRNTNYVELGPEDVVLQASNVSFDAATFEVWGALLNGGRLVGMKREDALTPNRYAEEVACRGVTTVFVTSALFNRIVEANPRTFAGMRNAMVGGQAVDPYWARTALKAGGAGRLLNGYGPTECTTFAAWYHIAEVAEDAVTVPIGRALGNTTLYVLDEEMRMAPVGALGELYIGGEGLARGYHGKAGMTAERFVPDAVSGESGARLYRTGDLVRRRWDGEIEFLGRLDQQVKLRGFRIELGEIEAVIGGHPEVRHSAVMLRGEGGEEPRLVGYVVVERGGQVERERVEEWQRLYEELYGKEGKEESFNIVGWNSSYTGEAIAAEEMREWREETVRRIRSLEGKRIWELGCGTGLLLLELAGECEEYVGTDFAEAGLAGLREEVERRGLKSVRLERREADDFKGVEAGRFDGVVVNSAVQYFPGMEYLEGVLKGAVEAVRDGGWVVVGDVRNLELLGAFHASVEMYRSGSGEKVEEVGDRVRRRMWEEEELVVSPEYFYGLAERWERVRQVEVEVKRGRGGNEMTRYRYEVVLEVGEGEAENVEVEERVSWQNVGGRLEKWLEESSAGVVEVEGIPNSRVVGDEWAWRAMEGGAKGSVGELRGSAMEAAERAVDPESLWEMGERHGWEVRVRWSAEDTGCVDLLVEKKSSGRRGWRRSQKKGAEGNQPLRARQERQLGEELKRHLEKRLPEYMIPVSYVVLESLPLTVNGKVDKRRLPAPERWKRIDKGAKVRPGSAEEEVLAGIWRLVLGVEEVGVEEDFFELGGHSLMATRVVSRIGRELGVEVGVRELFEAPTVRGLARRMEELRRGGKSGEQPAIVRVDRAGRLPLSYAQQRLWFVKQLVGEDVHYNMPAAFRLRGVLDVEVLRRSLSEMVKRHESLRTRFENHGGEPWQVIEESWEVELPVVEVRAGNEERVRELLEAEAGRPFDLERGPVFRTMVVRLGEEEHILSMTAHHIVFDGWSIGVFIGELASLYEGGVLEELEIQYADYAVWQRGWLQGRVLEEQMGYWRRQLGGMERLELPVDRTRRRMQRLKGAKVEVALGGALVEGLRRLGRRESSTLYMVMLAAFQGLLGRYSGQRDIAVGSPIANRRRGEVEKLIGFFVNTLVLRTNLAGDLGFVELLRRVREVALGAYAHQDVPFEQMVEELQPERDLSRNPLVQVIFALQNAPGGSLKLRGLKVEPVRMEWGSVRFDLEVQLWEEGEEIRGYLAYDADLYEEGTIRRMVGHYRRVLEEIVESPERRVSEWELVSGWERRQLLEEWNGEVRQGSREGTIQGRFEEQVERASEAVALEYEGERVSYGELNGRANQVGHWLRERGVGPEVRVGICVERSVEQVVGLLGILKAGGAYVPLDPGYPEERLEYMVEDAGIGVLVTERRQRGKLRVPAGVAVLEMDGDAEELARMPRTTVRVKIDSDNLAYVIYTSGSTGRPKGGMNSQRAVCNRLVWMQERYGLTAADRVLQKTPFSFDVSVWEFFWPLLTGARLVIARPEGHKDNEYLIEVIRKYGITTMHFVPSMLAAFLQTLRCETCVSLRRVICSGEALAAEHVRRFFQKFETGLHNLYGPTEAAVDVTSWECARQEDSAAVPIGRPITNTAIHILDRNYELAPIGVAGELYIAGVAVGRGYHNRPALTAAQFLPCPYSMDPGARMYRSGDLARWRSDGSIEFLGRIDYQVKIRGFRIELGEIEARLSEHASVTQCVVVARPDRAGDLRLIAYVECRDDGRPDAAEFRRYLGTRLPEYMVPAAYVLLDRLPLNANGKVDRNALPRPESQAADSATEWVAPRNSVEFQLAGIWSEVLGVERIGVHHDFFRLGGHSLQITQVLSRVRNTFDVEIPVRSVFEEPTIAAMAARVESLLEQRNNGLAFATAASGERDEGEL